MKIIKPPAALPTDKGKSVFLAGSIEMGQAEDWQSRFATALGDLDVTLFNPRRDEWDASWEQKKANSAFRGQVEWELAALERAEVIALYFDPKTQSPISLLEMGLFARQDKLIVCCPEGFWRQGNVDIVCERYGVPQVEKLEELIAAVRQKLIGG